MTGQSSSSNDPAAPKLEPAVQPDRNTGRSLGQILIILVVMLVLVNIPINYYGLGLARLRPDNPSTVIYEGMLLTGSGPEVYLLEDHKLRWISSPEVLERHFGRQNIELVDDTLLEQFGQGQPIRHLIRCQGSPYIYAQENGLKRSIQEPLPATRARPWDKVHRVSCDYLRRLPNGLPVEPQPQS
jgi:hypothetical protein